MFIMITQYIVIDCNVNVIYCFCVYSGEVQLSNDQKLEFYALFKQATIGQCNTIRPTMWNVVERYKWYKTLT